MKARLALWLQTGQLLLGSNPANGDTEPDLLAVQPRKTETIAGLVALGLVTLVVIVLVVWWWLSLPPLVFGG